MKYPCAMIQDLLPLYIDGVCSEESKKIIEDHLTGCAACRQLLEEMKNAAPTVDRQADLRAAEVLKQIKKRINSRVARILLGAAAAVAVICGSIFLLFSEPLKALGPEDVEMSAEIYDLQTLAAQTANPKTDGELVEVEVPGMGRINLHEETIRENPELTVISMGSDYHLRIVHWNVEDNTLYVSKITTTLLGNQALHGHEVRVSMHFERFDRIVYRPEGGGEEVLLWSEEP